MTTIRRGDQYPTGGRFVGVAPSGVVWVCYGNAEDFARMVLAFSRAYLKQQKAKGGAA